MKKILQINVLNETGSTGRIMQNISKSIENELGIISLTAYGYGSSQKNNSYKIGSKLDYFFHNIMSRLFCAQGHFSYFATKKFVNYLDKEKPDLIHLHNIHGNYVNYKLLFRYIQKHNIPVVWTLHDCWPFTGKCVYFDMCKCDKWKKKCEKCPILEEYPKSYLFDRSEKDYKLKKSLFTSTAQMHIVTPSLWLSNLVKESYLQKYPVTVIHNGIDLESFNETESDFDNIYNLKDKFVILGVATPWNKRKGLDDFRKLSYMVDKRFQIVIIGITEEQREGFSNNCLFFNRTDSVFELAQWYTRADVFFNPTYEDNFPTVNLEALACNTPVITYKTGGSPEMIGEKYGFVCEQGDVISAYACIHEIEKNIEKYKNGREIILKECNSLTIYSRYIDIYKKLLDGCDK